MCYLVDLEKADYFLEKTSQLKDFSEKPHFMFIGRFLFNFLLFDTFTRIVFIHYYTQNVFFLV